MREMGSRPVSRVLSRMAIHLGRTSPHASCSLPGDIRGPRIAAEAARPPIWPCSGWGLPCHLRYRRRGALLPHHFTLTGPCGLRRYIFCGTFRGLAPPRHYLAPCPAEPGLSSPPAETGGATIRPTPGRYLSHPIACSQDTNESTEWGRSRSTRKNVRNSADCLTDSDPVSAISATAGHARTAHSFFHLWPVPLPLRPA